MRQRSRSIAARHLVGLALLVLLSPLAACGGSGDDGSDGAPGQPGASTGTLLGTVTNALTGAPLSGHALTIVPTVVANPTTNATGGYSVTLPVGNYVVTSPASATFAAKVANVSVLAAQTTTQDFALSPAGKVLVQITGAPASPAPGQSFDLTANVTVLDGSTIQTFAWSQEMSAPATIASPAAQVTNVTLGSAAAYKTALVAQVEQLERWRVLPMNPHAQELGLTLEVECAVTTTSGTYHGTVEIAAHAPFAAWAAGIRNVPLGLPVLLAGKTQASYAWTMSTRPASSSAVLQDATTRWPWFVPDVAGKYSLSVQDLGAAGVVTLDVWAANWVGGIDGQDAAGRPQMNACKGCHPTEVQAIFDEWAQTGHAEIFTQNLNAGGHYSSACFPCHTVGYDPSVANAGFDDASGYATFYATMFAGGSPTPDPDNWTTVLSTWPEVAQKANVQCENCHGPNGSGGAHILFGVTPDPRASLASDVCAVCHGEPPRHARFQQWEESAHGNYELAVDESQSTSCARCHVAQGFLAWLPQVEGGNPGNLPAVPGPADQAHPVTCVVCHDPHACGTVSGSTGVVAPLRVEGSTPMLPSGFAATHVGKGAMCMMCHNTRNGAAAAALASNPDRAPHVAAQADVLMGQNAFYVGVWRSPHSFVEDSCVTCHMDLTDPPADLSYQLGGTNHTFEAEVDLCADCHGEFTADNLQAQFEEDMEDLAASIEAEIRAEIEALVGAGHSVRLYAGTGGSAVLQVTIDAGNVGLVQGILLTESSGRMAMDVVVDGTTYAGVQLGQEVRINGVSGQSLVSNSFFASDAELDLARCCWNYFLLHGDGSEGVHNPYWSFEVLDATATELTGLDWTLPVPD